MSPTSTAWWACLVMGGAGITRATSIRSSCSPGVGREEWSYDNVGSDLKSWLQSIVTVPENGETSSKLFCRKRNIFFSHFSSSNDALRKGDEYPGGPVVTIAAYRNVPSWQWISKSRNDGFLYGIPDDQGMFTGDSITFIYPDMVTGIRGRFHNGNLVEGTEVKILAHRCLYGLKQLKMAVQRPEITWRWEEQNATFIGSQPTVRDPYERRSVYINTSGIPGIGEGLFARRPILPGELVAYFGGLRTVAANMFFSNQTEEEATVAAAYYISIGGFAPDWWDMPPDQVVDIPPGYRRIEEYRTTLGHKPNHQFIDHNAVFSTVLHPFLGKLPCIKATKEIRKYDEIFVHYNYKPGGPDWYEQQYRDVYHKYPAREGEPTIHDSEP